MIELTLIDIVILLSEKYYQDIYNIGRNEKLYEEAIEYAGVHEIIERTAKTLLEKVQEDPVFDLKKKLNEWPYIKQIATNHIRNFTRHAAVEKRIKISSKSVLIDVVDLEAISTFGRKDPDAYKEADIIESLIATMEKLYRHLHLAEFEPCKNLVRYYQKLLNKIPDSRLKSAYLARLYEFNAELFFDQGKLKLSEKQALLSIKTYNESNHIQGHNFISNAYDILVLIYLNLKNYRKGIDTYDFNIKEIARDRAINNEFKTRLLNKSKLTFGMFGSTTNIRNMQVSFEEAIEFEGPSSKNIHVTYAAIYNMLDRGKHEEAQELVAMIRGVKLPEHESLLNSIRADIAIAESYTRGFTTYQFADQILSYCQFAYTKNLQVQSKYFDSMINILEGYAKKDNFKVDLYCNRLSELGFVHFSSWYKRKAIKNI